MIQLNERVRTLDYLRGLMAISIVIYHMSSWGKLQFYYPLDILIGKLGLYAVSAFYVLSGTSLALVYLGKEINKSFMRSFSIRRLFRIVPLFYIATILTILVSLWNNPNTYQIPNIKDLFLNFTLLFSWLDHDNYIATGAWSIGNEVFFYTLFPIILFLLSKSTKYFYVMFSIVILISLSFAYIIMDSTLPLANQWALYINPLNQLLFFLTGVLFGWLFRIRKFVLNNNLALVIFIISLCLFIFFQSDSTDNIVYITDFGRIVNSLAILSICYSVIYIKIPNKRIFHSPLSFLGEISYSIYLLHPIVYVCVNQFTDKFQWLTTKNQVIYSTIILSILFATLSYYFIEKKLIRLGRSIDKNREKKTKYNSRKEVI